jgi:bifunctional DNase/RNase
MQGNPLTQMTTVSCSVKGVFVVVGPSGTVPVVVLTDGCERVLPIFVGLLEAVSINSAKNREVLPRPFTHDLFLETFEKFGIVLRSLQIDSIQDGVYYAQLVLSSEDKEIRVDCRPSDGIALALRGDAPIYVDDSVIESAGHPESDLPAMTDIAEFLQK